MTPEAISVSEGQTIPAIKISTLSLDSSSQDLTGATCRFRLDNGYTATFSGVCMLGFNISDWKQ